jgi:sarcosine oxidase, subunit alpha
MMQPYRLAAGGRINRKQPLSFTFNGERYNGFLGDTLASALLANGVHFVARSFKYHRPRGILSAGAEEPNALIQLEEGAYTEPNLRATQVELYDGLRAASVNTWPTLRHDWGAINDSFSRLFVAGFYYKTLMRPRLLWRRLYEPFLRQMAGMGKAPEFPDPDIYDRMYRHCDVLVAGGGPAGIAAALASARTGARVVLADEQNEFGGSLLSSREIIDGRPAMDWATTALAELSALPDVVLLPRTTAFGYYDHNYVALVERCTDHLSPRRKPMHARQRLWHVRAKEVVLATGAHERPLVFSGNDRPGVMLAGAVETYVNRYAVRPGTQVVVFGNNDSAYRATLSLAEAGVEIVAIVDIRAQPNGDVAQEARRRGIPILQHHAIVATKGRHRVSSVEVKARVGNDFSGPSRHFKCDLLAVSGGWNPVVHLFSQSQGRLRFDERLAAFVPHTSAQRERSVGAARGSFDLRDCILEGLAAGAQASAAAGLGTGVPPPAPAVERFNEDQIEPLWLIPTDRALKRCRTKRFVDFQNDVTVADIKLAAREGLDQAEHTKRYTTASMGTDQGKTGNVAMLAILSEATGRTIADTGTTTFRAPYSPVTFGALAGRERAELADPIRVTPMHSWHVAAGAIFEDVGQWKRPRYYPQTNENMDDAVRRECRAVRTSLGVQDVTTLGKIDARGPDVAEFLDRVYTNSFSKLSVSRCRYGIMCNDDGMVSDDGVTTRLAENHYYITTTTGGAGRVMERLEEWLQTEWPELKVYLTSVTEQWAAAAIAGPHARHLMHDLAPDLALDNASFPFLSARASVVAGLPSRVFRISFSGELAYEINVPARFGLSLWESIVQAGTRYNITPYGTETMHVLRAEKGFIIVGQETDGTTTPVDLGMDWIISKQKSDFVGKRSLDRPDTSRADRKQLVGLLPDDPDIVLPEGTQLTDGPSGHEHFHRNAVPMIGHVTSSYWGPALGRGFALALVKRGRHRIGDSIVARLETGPISVKVVAPQFFDKEGARQNG